MVNNTLNRIDWNNIVKFINNDNEKIDLAVVCFGGCASNYLVDALERCNLKIKTYLWREHICHMPKYYNLNIPIIYLYDNPIKAFLSQKRRGQGIWDVNQKKMCNKNNIYLSDEILLKCMIRQWKSFCTIYREDVLILKTCQLFEPDIKNKIEKFLNRKLSSKIFPLKYKPPNIDINNPVLNYKETKLFEQYFNDLLTIVES